MSSQGCGSDRATANPGARTDHEPISSAQLDRKGEVLSCKVNFVCRWRGVSQWVNSAALFWCECFKTTHSPGMALPFDVASRLETPGWLPQGGAACFLLSNSHCHEGGPDEFLSLSGRRYARCLAPVRCPGQCRCAGSGGAHWAARSSSRGGACPCVLEDTTHQPPFSTPEGRAPLRLPLCHRHRAQLLPGGCSPRWLPHIHILAI